MKLLVTGGEGQLAQALVELGYLHSGVEVVALGRAQCDVCAQSSIKAAIDRVQPDVILNAAAYTAVDRAESELDIAFAINSNGAGNVALAAAVADIPLIHISTDYVFDGTKADAYIESDQAAPRSVYGLSKLQGEQLVAQLWSRHVILRTAWLHSPWGKNFVKTMIRLAQSRTEIGVVIDQTGSPTYAPHLATAILAIAHTVRNPLNSAWGTYHAAGSGETTWHGFASAIFEEASFRGLGPADLRAISTSDYPTPATRPVNSRLAGFKLANDFGVVLPNWRIGVTECVRRLLL